MSLRVTLLWLTTILLAAGCNPPPAVTEAPEAINYGQIVGDVLVNPPRAARPYLNQGLGANGKHIIFLNFEGGVMTPGRDDSTQNRSSIAGSLGHDVDPPPFDVARYSPTKSREQVIAELTAKVQGFYRQWNLQVVDSRPTSGNYVMMMVGEPSLVDESCAASGCVLGLSPLDCRSTSPIDYNASDDTEVAYCFADAAASFGGSYATKRSILGVTVAHEAGHTFGLGHTDNPDDVMYPVTNGRQQGFLVGGYADSGNCAGSVGTQDGPAILGAVLGPSTDPVDTTPPTISILSPVDGSVVPRTFEVRLRASDDQRLVAITVTVDGTVTDQGERTFGGSPVDFTLNATADGQVTITATAMDGVGQETPATSTFQVRGGVKASLGAPCTAPGQCESQICDVGYCTVNCGTCPSGYRCGRHAVCEFEPAAKGEVGAACSSDGQCLSGECLTNEGRRFCGSLCNPADSGSCPSEMTCASLDGIGPRCVLGPASGSSGCAVGGPAPLVGLLALALLLLPLAWRRSRRPVG